MRNVLPQFEHRAQSVISRTEFLLRLGHSGVVSVGLIGVSLFAGMFGYRVFEGISWIDAFLNASMLLAAWAR